MKYKLRIAPWLYALTAVLYVAAGACLVLNVIRLVGYISSADAVTVYAYISAALCIIIPVLFVLIVTAIIAVSYYKIENGKLFVRYGFLKEYYALSEMDNIVRDIGKKQLVLVFKDESGLKITIDEKYFNDFSAELMKAEPRISYSEYVPPKEKKDDEK